MTKTHLVRLTGLAAVTLALLAACGGETDEAPSPTPEATVTPKPFPTTEPTLAPPTPLPTPTGAVSAVVPGEGESEALGSSAADAALPVEGAEEGSLPADTATDPPPPAPGASYCGASGGAPYGLIPFIPPAADHPDYLHGDLNFALRGYAPTDAPKELVDYDGVVDSNAPQMKGLFTGNRIPTISNVYQTTYWVWDPGPCGGSPHGCAGGLITDWPVTVVGFATTPGEAIHIPQRAPEIYPDGSIAMVLYADVNRITLNYNRDDSVAYSYAVHIEGICVDPDLLALYRAQTDGEGWHVTGQLPAVRNDQPIGTALGGEIQVAIRDNGRFMDPRTRKDWWHGQ